MREGAKPTVERVENSKNVAVGQGRSISKVPRHD